MIQKIGPRKPIQLDEQYHEKVIEIAALLDLRRGDGFALGEAAKRLIDAGYPVLKRRAIRQRTEQAQ